MIYNINKDDCYKISGSLVLNNKYVKVEGNTFSSGYVQKTLGNEYANPTSDEDGVGYDFSAQYDLGRYKVGDYWTRFGLRFYYKTYEIRELTSDTILDVNVSAFNTKVTSEKNTVTANVGPVPTGVGNGRYVEYITYGSNGGYQHEATVNNVKKYLGCASVEYSNITLYSVKPIIRVVYKIELMMGQSSDRNNVPNPRTVIDTVSMGTEIQYSVLCTSLYQTSNEFNLGVDSPIETYKLANNVLFDIASKRDEMPLIEAVATTILNNHAKGKQIVKIQCPTLDIKDADGNISSEHLFEPGQYFYILDEVGDSLFKYKLTNIPKIFEIISAEYVQENWNLVLKEVAKVESNWWF